MNRIFKKNKSKGKGSTAEAASVNSGEGAIQAQVADYNVKEKELPKLHKAAWNGDVSKLRNLVGKKQDFNALDKANRTPLHLACFNGHVEVVKFLVGSKVKLNVCDSDQRSPLMRAVQGDHFDVAEFLLKRNADPSLIDINGDAALHIAVYGGSLETVKLLLDFGAVVDATNKQGSTPLHVATIQGSTEIVEVLLQNKADVNVQDNLSRTPLMLACQADQIGIVKMLLEHRADPNIRDQKGWTANDHAIMGGYHGCSHLIEEQQTIKRTSTGSALSGTGLFGSTTNSVDALGFPLANPAATSDLSGDNEEELSIDKKSDEDSWAASNSEFDDHIPKKSLPLFGGKKTPSIKSYQSDSSMKSRDAQIPPRNNSTKGMFGTQDKKKNNVEELPGLGITPRSVSEVVEEEKPTPRGRASSRGLISSGTISDWDDDSDILDDLSEKKGKALPIKIGSHLKMKKPQNDNAANISSDQGGFNNELSDVDEDTLSEEVKKPAIAAIPAASTAATDKLPPKNVAAVQDKPNEIDENSDSDWDSEADDILPSDNSADGEGLRGYTPTGVLNGSLKSGRALALSPSEERPSSLGTMNAGISDSSYGKGKVTPTAEEEESEEEWIEERAEGKDPRNDLQASSSSLKAMKKVLNTDQENTVEKQITQVETSTLGSRNVPTDSKPITNEQSVVKDNREIENRRKLLDEERDIIKREKEKLEEEKKRQEEMIEKRLLEVQAEEDERRDKEMQERKKLEEEWKRMEEQTREQQAKLEKEKKELEEMNKKKHDEMEKELEEKKRQSDKEREMELQRLEDEKQKMQEELMAERHRLAEEKKQLEERIMLQEEKEAEIRENMESKKSEEWQSVLDEKDRMAEDVKRQREALEKEKEKIDEERRKEIDQLKQDREKLEEEKEEVERVKKEAETVKQEKRRIEEEKVKLQKAEKDAEKLEMEKRRLEEEREKLEEEKKEAEKIKEEKKRLEEKKRELEKAKEEAELIEKERQRLVEERKQVEIVKAEKEKFELERKSLEEEKKQLEAVKKGETDYVDFEKKKLERERQQLEKSRKDEEEYIKLQKEKIEEEKKRLEKIKMEAEERANDQEEKLESKRQEFEAKRKEEEDKMRKMQVKMKELEEKSKQLEEENRERMRATQNGLENSEQNGVVDIDRGRDEEGLDRNMIGSDLRKDKPDGKGGGKFKKDARLGSEKVEVKQNLKALHSNRIYNSNGMFEADESETDSEAAELLFETKPSQGGLDWQPNGLLGGAPPRTTRKAPKKAQQLFNGISSGNPAVNISNLQGLLDEYDGLDYSSSSVGEDMEDDAGLGHLSPVSASTPMVPRAGTLPLSPTFQLSQPGATTQMQNVIQDLRYKSAKERQSARLAQNKVRQLEAEKEDILQKLDDCINEREILKGSNLELEKKLQLYEHEIDQEREQRCSAELLLKKIKAHLSKKDHQLSDEQQAREQAEMALCKLQVDLRVMQNTVHQLEVERDEMQRHFTENENSLKYQQKLMETQHMKQETLHETGSVVLLEAADESRKAAWSQSEKLKEELFDMKVEMERLQFKYKGNEGALTSQIQDLESKLADLRQEQIINEDALHHASQAFHAQLTAVKIENSQLKTTLAQEQDKVAGLNTKVDSLKKENDKLLGETQNLKQTKEESERTAGNKIDKLASLLEERKIEISHLKEIVKGNEKTIESLQLKASHLKEQLSLTNQALLERTNQLNTFQREMDKKLLTEEGHSKVIHLEREEKAKLANRNDMLTERLDKAHEENLQLKQEMERLKTEMQQRDRDSEDARERLNSTINAAQKEKDQVKSLWEEKQTTMVDNLQTLKETIGRSQSDFREKESEVRALRQQLSEAEKKLALAEANMVVLQKTCDNKERETKDSQNELKQLHEKIMVSEMTKSRVESKLEDAQKSLQEMEHRLKESCNDLMQAKKSLEQQEVDVRKLNELEREKAKLEVIIEQEKDRNQSLKKELEHATQMKNNLEVLLTELKNANLHIGEKLNMESAARNLMSQEVDDHKELWESELKSKSKLGLRLSQLQRARVDQQGQLEEEKRRSQKALEMMEQLNEKLETEKERNHQLDQTNLLLRSKLKTAKKKLQDLQIPEAKIQSLQTEFERERFNLEAALATQRKQLENANEKLEREYTARKKLEGKNNSLQLELKTAKSLEKKSSELYKSNKRLEAELADTKKSIQDSYVEKGELEKYKQNMDTKLRHDINEKLAQVNTYLDEQCLAREKIDQVQQDTEAELRKELEKSISDLKNEVTKLRTSNSDLTAKRETLEAELQRFKTLFKQESEKSQKLTDELEQYRRKATELKTQVRIEQQRALQLRTETPTLVHTSQKFGPPRQQQQQRSVDDITSSVREELNRSISRHMEGSSPDLDYQYRGHTDINTDPTSPGSSYLAILKKNYFV